MAASNSSDRPRKARNARAGNSGSGSSRSSSPGGARANSNSRPSRAAARQLRSRDARADRGDGASPSPDKSAPAEDGSAPKTDGLTGLAEQLASRILKPLGLVVLSRERISDTVLEAAEEGRLTRSDAEQLASELIQRGSQQTDELLNDLDQTLDRSRQRLDTATKKARSVAPDRLVRGADRARRTIRVGPTFPILGYDDLSVAEVQTRLPHLTDPQLRKVRDYERRHANRKSLLTAIEKALG